MIFNLFKKNAVTNTAKPDEQAVILTICGPQLELDDINGLEERLIEIVSENGVGEVDGHDIAMDGSDANLYLYGPSADKLFSVIEKVLRDSSFVGRILCKRRYGDVKNPKTKIVEIKI